MDIAFGLNDQVGFYWYDNENKEIFETGFIVDSFLIFVGPLENKKKINEVSLSIISPINEQDRLSRKIDLSFDDLQGVVRDTFVFETTKKNFNFFKIKGSGEQFEAIFFTIYSFVQDAYYIVSQGNLKLLARATMVIADADEEDIELSKDNHIYQFSDVKTELAKIHKKSLIVLITTHGKILASKNHDPMVPYTFVPDTFKSNLNLVQMKASVDGISNFFTASKTRLLSEFLTENQLPDVPEEILKYAKKLREHLRKDLVYTKQKSKPAAESSFQTNSPQFQHDPEQTQKNKKFLTDLKKGSPETIRDITEYYRQIPHAYTIYEQKPDTDITDKSFFTYDEDIPLNNYDEAINIFSEQHPFGRLDYLKFFSSREVSLKQLLKDLEETEVENVLLIDTSCNNYSLSTTFTPREIRHSRKNQLAKKYKVPPANSRSSFKNTINTPKKSSTRSSRKKGGQKTSRCRRTQNRFTRRNRGRSILARRHTFRSMRQKANATKRTHKR